VRKFFGALLRRYFLFFKEQSPVFGVSIGGDCVLGFDVFF
jgi:hypothetical protein